MSSEFACFKICLRHLLGCSDDLNCSVCGDNFASGLLVSETDLTERSDEGFLPLSGTSFSTPCSISSCRVRLVDIFLSSSAINKQYLQCLNCLCYYNAEMLCCLTGAKTNQGAKSLCRTNTEECWHRVGVHSKYKHSEFTTQTFRCFLELLTAFLLTPLPGFEDLAKSRKLAFALWGIVPCATPLSHHCAVVLLRFIIY